MDEREKKDHRTEVHIFPLSHLSPQAGSVLKAFGSLSFAYMTAHLLQNMSQSMHWYLPGSLHANHSSYVTIFERPLICKIAYHTLPPPGFLSLCLFYFYYIKHINIWYLLFNIFCFFVISFQQSRNYIFSFLLHLSYKTCVTWSWCSIYTCVAWINVSVFWLCCNEGINGGIQWSSMLVGSMLVTCGGRANVKWDINIYNVKGINEGTRVKCSLLPLPQGIIC